MATTKLMTAEEFLLLGDANWRHELIRGGMVQLPPAGPRHGELSLQIASNLWDFVSDRNLGVVTGSETGFTVARDPDVVLSPDGAFVQTARLPDGEAPEGYFEGAPDLIVEIISATDKYVYVNEKIVFYLESGAQLIWVVDPFCQLVTAYYSDRTGGLLMIEDELDGGEVLPGFRVPVAEIFE